MRRPIRILLAAVVGVGAAFVVPSISSSTAVVAAEQGKDEMHKLGRQKVGTVEVSVITFGEVEPGAKVRFSIKIFDTNEPKAMRVWIGTQDAAGSTRAEGKKESTAPNGILYAGEVQAPKPIPEGAKLWVELETAAGTHSAGWNYDVHDHKH